MKLQEKIKIFIWRLYHNFLPVGVGLILVKDTAHLIQIVGSVSSLMNHVPTFF